MPTMFVIAGSVAVLLVVYFAIKFRRGRGRLVLTATFTTTGTSQVWNLALPKDTLVISRLALALLWVVKLRWLLNSEPVHAREALDEVVDDYATCLRMHLGSTDESLKTQKLALQMIGLGGTPRGTMLNIDLFYAPYGEAKWLINNNFPLGLTHGDFIWSVVSLFDEILEGMAPQNQEFFLTALEGVADLLQENPEINSTSFSALHRMTLTVNTILIYAGAATILSAQSGNDGR